jgi:hypothetical protein
MSFYLPALRESAIIAAQRGGITQYGSALIAPRTRLSDHDSTCSVLDYDSRLAASNPLPTNKWDRDCVTSTGPLTLNLREHLNAVLHVGGDSNENASLGFAANQYTIPNCQQFLHLVLLGRWFCGGWCEPLDEYLMRRGTKLAGNVGSSPNP